MIKYFEEKKKKKQAALRRQEEAAISQCLVEIDDSIEMLQNYADTLRACMDDAALGGDEEEVDDIIECKCWVDDLIKMLAHNKRGIMRGMYDSTIMAGLATLPGVVAACKGIINRAPDFSKLGGDFEELFADIQELQVAMSGFTKALDPNYKSSHGYNSKGRKKKMSQKDQERYDKERAACQERIKSRISSTTVATPDSSRTDDIDNTGDIDVEGLIRRENNDDTDR